MESGDGGESMVAVIQGLRHSGLAVTLMSRSQLQNSLKKSKRAPVGKSSVETSTELPINNTSVQIRDGIYTSYQLAHCRLIPSSPDVNLPEFPLQRAEPSRIGGNFEVGGYGSGRETSYPGIQSPTFRRSQISRGFNFSTSPSPTDSFADSLRKYSPHKSTSRIMSSELVQRLLNYTQAKYLSKRNSVSLRSLRDRSPRRSKESSDKKTTTRDNKNIQTYTRTADQVITKNNEAVKKKECKQIKRTSNIKAKYTADQLSEYYDYFKATISGKPHYTGQSSEVRYVNAMKQYIRQTMGQIVEPPSTTVCPKVKSRYNRHKKAHHQQSIGTNNNEEFQARAGPSRRKNEPSVAYCDPFVCPNRNRFCQTCQPTKSDDTVCPNMAKRYNRHWMIHHRNEKTDTSNGETHSSDVQGENLSLYPRRHSSFGSQSPCTSVVAPSEAEEQILIWLKDLPVYANEPPENKGKRQEMAKELVNNLSNLISRDENGSKLKEEIDKFMDNLPIWHPENKEEQEMHKKKLADVLSAKLDVTETPNIKNVISNWLDKIPVEIKNSSGRRISNNKVLSKLEQHLEPIMKRIGSAGELKNEVLKIIPEVCQEMGINVENELIGAADKLVSDLNDMKKQKDKIKRKFASKGDDQRVSMSIQEPSNKANKGLESQDGNNENDKLGESYVFPKGYQPDKFPLKSAEKKYTKYIKETIKSWMDETSLNLNTLDENSLKETMINDIAADIVDRQKYLQLTPNATKSVKEELEHLKYQVYRWLNKVVDSEDLASIIPKTQALMDKINVVPVPKLSAVETSNAKEAIEDIIFEWIEGIDSDLVSPSDKNKLMDRMPGLVEDLQRKRLSNQIGETENILDIISPLIKSVKENIGERDLHEMGENLKSSLQERGLTNQFGSDQLLKSAVKEWVKTLKLPESDDPSTFENTLKKAQNDLISTLSNLLLQTDKVPFKDVKKHFRDATYQFLEKIPGNRYETEDINILGDSLLDTFEDYSRKFASFPSGAVQNKVADILLDDVSDWVKSIPMEEDTPEKSENAKRVKQQIESKLMRKIRELNKNPEIANDDSLYEEILQNEVDNILRNVSSQNVRRYLPEIKKDFMEKVKTTRQNIRDINAEKSYKQQQNGESYTDSVDTFKDNSKKDSIIPSGSVKKKAADVLLDDIAVWVKNIPIEEDTPEKSEYAKKVKQQIESQLIHKIGELNMNPEIMNDDFLYDEMLEDEVDNLLSNITSDNVRKNLPLIKKGVMEKVKEARQKIRDVNAGHVYKQQLREDISNTLPFVDLSEDEQASFEVLKDEIADAFINLHYVGNDEKQIDKLQKKIRDEINKFSNDYLKKHPGTPIDTRKLNQDLYNALRNISEPNNDSFRNEVELLKLKDDINDWAKELPLRKQTGQDKLLTNKTISVLAKKLHEIENEKELIPSKDYDEKIKKEITKYFNKLPLTIEKEEDINRYAEKLLANLKETEESRKLNASTRYSIEPEIDSNNSYLNSMPPCMLSITDRAHLERIRERSLNARLRPTPKDTSVSARPIDADSQTEIISSNLGTCPVPKRCLAQQSVQTPCQKMQAVGSQIDITPHVVIKEYYWDSAKETSMPQPTEQSQNLCPASPCVSIPEHTLSTSYRTGPCDSQYQIPCTPKPCSPTSCQIPYRPSPCSPEQNLCQTQGTQAGSQHSPRSAPKSHSMSEKKQTSQRPSPYSTPCQLPYPGTTSRQNASQIRRPMSQQGSQNSSYNAPKPCITSTPCSPHLFKGQSVSPHSYFPHGRPCDSRHRFPCSSSPKQHCHMTQGSMISSEDEPEPNNSFQNPRVTRLGSFDHTEPPVCNKSRFCEWGKFLNNYEYWEKDLNAKCIPSERDFTGKYDGNNCRCKHKCSRGIDNGCHFHDVNSMRRCPKCCGVHCPYPSHMFFKH